MLANTKAFSGFSVDNLQKAEQFYSEILGLDVSQNSMGILELNTKDNNPIIVYPKPDHTPATFTILNFTVTDIEDVVDKLIEKGVKFEQYGGDIQTDKKGICRNSNGPLIAWFKDPAGNIFSVLEEK